jgi:hypothetical protein
MMPPIIRCKFLLLLSKCETLITSHQVTCFLHTVRIELMVCSATLPASPYFICARVESVEISRETIAPAMTIGGIQESITSVRCHPLTKATMKPPKNVVVSCKNFPT